GASQQPLAQAVSLFGRLAVPSHGFLRVAGGQSSGFVEITQNVLRWGVSELGGAMDRIPCCLATAAGSCASQGLHALGKQAAWSRGGRRAHLLCPNGSRQS